MPADRLDVLDRGDEAGEQLVRERAGLERMASRPHLVRAPLRREVGADGREPEMRAEELVRRAEEDVRLSSRDVDRPVRAVVHGVDPGERAGGVRELGDAPRVGQRSDRVRREREGDDARAVGELPLEVVVVERRVVGDLDEADLEAEIVRELEPGRRRCRRGRAS